MAIGMRRSAFKLAIEPTYENIVDNLASLYADAMQSRRKSEGEYHRALRYIDGKISAFGWCLDCSEDKLWSDMVEHARAAYLKKG